MQISNVINGDETNKIKKKYIAARPCDENKRKRMKKGRHFRISSDTTGGTVSSFFAQSFFFTRISPSEAIDRQ